MVILRRPHLADACFGPMASCRLAAGHKPDYPHFGWKGNVVRFNLLGSCSLRTENRRRSCSSASWPSWTPSTWSRKGTNASTTTRRWSRARTATSSLTTSSRQSRYGHFCYFVFSRPAPEPSDRADSAGRSMAWLTTPRPFQASDLGTEMRHQLYVLQQLLLNNYEERMHTPLAPKDQTAAKTIMDLRSLAFEECPEVSLFTFLKVSTHFCSKDFFFLTVLLCLSVCKICHLNEWTFCSGRLVREGREHSSHGAEERVQEARLQGRHQPRQRLSRDPTWRPRAWQHELFRSQTFGPVSLCCLAEGTL